MTHFVVTILHNLQFSIGETFSFMNKRKIWQQIAQSLQVTSIVFRYNFTLTLQHIAIDWRFWVLSICIYTTLQADTY